MAHYDHLLIRRSVVWIWGVVFCALVATGCARGKAAAGGEAAAPVLTVSPAHGGGQFASIQKAIDKAPEGAIIRIAPGRYTENLHITKPLTLEGAGWDKTEIVPPGVGKDKLVGLVKKFEHEMHYAKTPAERNAVRRKMIEEVFTPPLLVTGTRGVAVRGLRLTQLPADKTLLPAGRFAAGFLDAGVELSDCVIAGSTNDGVQIVGASDVALRGCLIAAAWGTGVVIEGATGAEAPPRALIAGCDIRNNHYAGVVMRRAGTGVRIEDCRISGSAWHGIRYYDGSSPAIERNAIFRHARFALYAGGGPTAAQVRHNLLYANEMAGMLMEGDAADLIERNTFARNGRESLTWMGGVGALRLEGNLFFENASTIAWGVNNERAPTPAEAAALVPAQNVWWPGTRSRGGASGGMAAVFDPAAMAPASVVEPRFADAAKEDFRLALGWTAPWGEAGAAGFPALESPWPLQAEELAIIPPAHTRDTAHWTPPAQAWGIVTEE